MKNNKNNASFTDAEIIKAFILCDDSGSCHSDCPLARLNNRGVLICRTVLKKSMLDIYSRQKAEIERKVDEQKYNKAILVLQAIAQHRGSHGRGSNEYFDEWTQARAFKSCREAALRCLKSLGEPVTMTNKRNGR